MRKDYIEEKDIEGAITSIQGESLEKINEQMKICSCKIECYEKGNGSGFFSLIPFPNKIHLIPVLMTNNHILQKEDIIKGKKININMKDKKFSILIDDSRKVFTDKNYDITIIEIKNNDGLDFNKFLEIDDSIHKENLQEYFKNRSIYLIHHPKSKEDAEFAVGIIKYKVLDSNDIYHTCKSEPGSSGSPILDLKTNRIIGIHKGSASNNIKLNVGTFIKEPIEEFYKEYINKIKLDEILIGYPNKENEIKNIKNNDGQNRDNSYIGKNNKSELKFDNIIKIQNINDKENNNISDNDNEFSLFNQYNENNNDFNLNSDNNNKKIKDDLMEENIYKNFDGNNNLELKDEKVLNNNINDNGNKMINNNIMGNNDNEINNNINENMIYNLNNYIPKENEEENLNIIDEITIKYIKEKAKFFDSLLKLQLFKLKESNSSDKLFGEHFVEINKHLCKIIIGNKKYELKSYLNKECDEVNKNEFEIKLKGISKVTDLTCMFCGCLSLDYIKGFSNINTSKITRLSHLFSFCKIISIPDISKWDASNFEYIDHMFLYCFNLKSLPDISKWNTSKVKSITNLFTDCRSLEYIPDISKWGTNNLESISDLFSGRCLLKSLPDISNWKTTKIKSFHNVFAECYKLVNLFQCGILIKLQI